MIAKLSREIMDEKALRAAQAFGDATRYEILKLLEREGKLSANEIAVRIGKHRATVDKHLKLLSETGFVTREYDEKSGLYLYSLTEGAKRVLEEFERALMEGKEFTPKPKLEIPVRRKGFIEDFLRALIRSGKYVPPIVFLIIGFLGMMAPIKVSFMARATWFSIFLIMAWLWIKVFRSISER